MKIQPLLSAVALAAILTSATAAGANTYTSVLEYQNGASGVASPSPNAPFGLVTLQEMGDGKTVQVTVHLEDADSLFINTGGPHDPFLFNTTNDEAVTIQPVVGKFYDAGHGTFNATPFGDFSDKIGLGTFVAETTIASGFHFVGSGRNKVKVIDYTTVPAHWQESGNGAAHGQAGDLVFTVFNASGLTFLGGADHFTSNAGGWWFSADIYDGATKQTYNVAARDATCTVGCTITTTVPEPDSWALMILGFGGLGGVLRRRRSLPQVA
ncbi:MAG: sorting protein [Caulobacteraceae bacterium]|nr:sorting protein [Caulobacteraceae bacterium]